MMKIAAVHINTGRPKVLADFYRQMLRVEPEWTNEDIVSFVLDGVRLEIMKHEQVSGMNPHPERSFFDFQVEDTRAEFSRILALGATAVQEPYEFDIDEAELTIATLADPDGNFFQLVAMEPK